MQYDDDDTLECKDTYATYKFNKQLQLVQLNCTTKNSVEYKKMF